MTVECSHRILRVRTEADRCSWVECMGCGKTGPKKHSYLLGVVAWLATLGNQHPRQPRTKRKGAPRGLKAGSTD